MLNQNKFNMPRKLIYYSILLFILGCANNQNKRFESPKLIALDTLYYENSLKIKGIYTKVNESYTGSFKEYYESGNLKSIGYFGNSVIIDTLKEYYDSFDKKLKSISIYSLTDTSKVQILNKQVRPLSNVSYQRSYLEFYKNGVIKTKGQYSSIFFVICKEKKENTITNNDETINISASVERLWSCKSGQWIYLDSIGNVIKSEEFSKNNCFSCID